MIAVPSSGPLTLDLTFDETRVWGTIRTGASGAYVGDVQGSVANGGTQVDIAAALTGPGCPEGLQVNVTLNTATGRASVTFRLNGGSISGPATLTQEK